MCSQTASQRDMSVRRRSVRSCSAACTPEIGQGVFNDVTPGGGWDARPGVPSDAPRNVARRAQDRDHACRREPSARCGARCAAAAYAYVIQRRMFTFPRRT